MVILVHKTLAVLTELVALARIGMWTIVWWCDVGQAICISFISFANSLAPSSRDISIFMSIEAILVGSVAVSAGVAFAHGWCIGFKSKTNKVEYMSAAFAHNQSRCRHHGRSFFLAVPRVRHSAEVVANMQQNYQVFSERRIIRCGEYQFCNLNFYLAIILRRRQVAKLVHLIHSASFRSKTSLLHNWWANVT